MRLSGLGLGLAVVSGLMTQISNAETTCAKDGGTESCIPYKVSDWSEKTYVCTTVDKLIDPLFCTSLLGGVWGGWADGSCTNDTPITDENAIPRITAYGNYWLGPVAIKASEWGYNNTVCSSNAIGDNGMYLHLNRRYDVFGANGGQLGVQLTKIRQLSCPEGFIDNHHGCVAKTPKVKSCPATANENTHNPCSVTTGNKTLYETDWVSSNSPLKVGRTYSSLYGIYYNPWSQNYANSIEIGQIEDKQLTLKSRSLDEPNTAVVLVRSDGTRVVAQRNFTDHKLAGETQWYIDRDMSLQILQLNEENAQIKNVKTGVIETYVKSATQLANKHMSLARIDYPNGQYINFTYQNDKLSKATDNFGNTLIYQYDSTGNLTQITLPNNNSITYTYDSLNRLVTVKRPGYGVKTYVYDEADKAPNDNPNLLTGIIDENGKRYATYGYDNENRGILTEHANETQKATLKFDSYENRVYDSSVTDEYNTTLTYHMNVVSGTPRIAYKRTPNNSIYYTYDTAGNIISETTYGQSRTVTNKYSYDETRNLEISKVISYGTEESRITLTEWATDKPVKTKITEGSANPDGSLKQALRITSYTYDDKGNALTKTVTDPVLNQSRTWTYTYNANSQKLTETNPQGQVTKWEYNDKGFLTKSIDAQGLITTYSDLNADGKPQTITSPTGQVTNLTYDDAGRVLTQTVTINTPTLTDVSANQGILSTISNTIASVFSSDSSNPAVKYDITKQATQTATTSYQYDGVGQLIKTTLPDGQTISYTYDDAHRMTGMTDSLGNTISYTLNGAGDIIQTDNKDASGTLAQTTKQTFDTLGRLSNQTGNNGQSQSYGYDSQDNLTNTKDALSRTTSSQYDSLKRKIKDVDANGQPVSYTYNALDQLLTVKDSNNATTSYTYNAFGDVLTTSSTDTGTSTNSYNDKGQLIAQTDGAGRVQNYAYDDKGRLISRTDSTGKVLASYQYDDKGRISLLTDTSGTTAYQYNSNNQVIEKKQTTEDKVFLTRYHYTAGGQLDELLLPSGQLVQYQYDKGVLKGVLVKTTDGNSTQVIDSISYSPNGIKGYNWSQTKQAVSYQYDLDGRLTAISDPALQRQYQYDEGNRITTLTDSKANLNALFTHDKLDRLTKQTFNTTNSLGYSYDNNSNRTQKVQTSNGVAQTSNTAVKANTNQYQAYQYDPSGKTINDGTRSYTYNSEGRIERIQAGTVGVVNGYNALGQRVQKNSGTTKTYFVYDERGKLISESDTSGNVVREYVYLGNMPVALLSSEKPNAIINVHADHLGTPRAMTDSTNQVLWRWEGDAFGDVQPQLATVKMPLRMAGQYEDSETGLFYNYFRFYDPKTGRYVENDPIDLAGGLNRYGYVGGSPLSYVDPTGLIVKWTGNYKEASIGSLLSAKFMDFELESECKNNKKYKIKVKADGWEASVGFSFLGFVSLGSGSGVFYENSDTPNPNSFNGKFAIAQNSIAVGIGDGLTDVGAVVLGSNLGDLSGLGSSTDLYSIEMGSGKSKVISIEEESCCEN